MKPTTHNVESPNGLQILEWPSGALEFRRVELGNTKAVKTLFHCFVISGAERKKFLEKLDEIREAN